MSEINQVVRVGVIGAGNMGSFYARELAGGGVQGAVLAGVCDADPGRLDSWPEVAGFTDAEGLLNSGEVDAVIIATPHYAHTPIGIAALERGLHVLVDKPISVHKADALRLIAAHRDPTQVFAAMFNQRTDGFYWKIKELLDGGAVGEIRRVNWIITNWFRTEAYYASGGWRATWAGEGGGVLLNQCPHQLDMLCWLVGTPVRVQAECRFGRYHEIEVEDDVTALLDFANGATGVFVTSTGEAPGTNRLEIAGEKGKVVFEDDRLTFYENAEPMSEFSRRTTEGFAAPEVTVRTFDGLDHGEQHLGVLRNFVAAIREGERLIAPAAEGLASVELANAMLMSAFEGRAVELPLDAEVYEARLRERIDGSTLVKKTVQTTKVADMTGSFR
ncbi:MAG TPA: Gfo/Idh/MocA family oxidoreductase [Kiritimatiellia bacterium]|nr:Gfo/Idh/MocA family oxidoreductase [Kiritimatiellia bacterium]